MSVMLIWMYCCAPGRKQLTRQSWELREGVGRGGRLMGGTEKLLLSFLVTISAAIKTRKGYRLSVLACWGAVSRLFLALSCGWGAQTSLLALLCFTGKSNHEKMLSLCKQRDEINRLYLCHQHLLHCCCSPGVLTEYCRVHLFRLSYPLLYVTWCDSLG